MSTDSFAEKIEPDLERMVREVCTRNGDRGVYGYLAKLVLSKLDGPISQPEWESRTVQECAEADFAVRNVCLGLYDPDMKTEVHRTSQVFQRASEEFSLRVNSFVYDADCGLPLYLRDDEGRLRQADNQNDDFNFVSQLLKYDSINSHYYSPPAWSRVLYLKQSDISAFWLFYADGVPEGAKEVRRAALQAYLAGQLNVSPANMRSVPPRGPGAHVHLTRLSRMLELTRERYYGPNYSPHDADTLARQSEVIEWLTSAHGLSKREAEAIDIILRPDTARRRLG